MDDINEAWERREWQERMVNNLPKKIGWALLRYHACTGIMRFYEFILGRFVLRVDVVPIEVGGSTTNTPTSVPSSSSSAMTQEQAITIMDKLTRDPFQSSLRTSQLLHNQENFLGKVISSDGMTETSTSRELMRRMFSTCIWANIIPFLAELTVQQGVLVYGYGIYYLEKKRRRRAREEAGKKLGRDLELIEEEKEEVDGSDEEKDGGKDAEEDVNESAYALSLLVQSTRLSIVKGCSWITASAGGAVGSALYPGWGTVFGIQIGDTMVGALID